jgi:monoamine oxidase
MDCDAIVLGAGAAGMAAAVQLQAAGWSVQVIEARDRIGGRIHTLRDPRHPVPIELGAEFVHGQPAVIWDRLRAHGLRAYDALGNWWRSTPQGLQAEEANWDKLEQILEAATSGGQPDQTFAEALEALGDFASVEERETARGFIEGFHAADIEKISVQALAQSGIFSDDDSAGNDRSFRMADGYDRLIESFFSECAWDRCQIRFNTVASRIDWSPGQVTLHARSRLGFELPPVRAKLAVITLPIGVLKAPPGSPGALAFAPELEAIERALGSIHMGTAHRIVFRFRRAIWETEAQVAGLRHRGVSDLGYAQNSDAMIPVWWTTLPVHAPVITGWVGGPPADRLSHCTRREIVEEALSSLGRSLAIPLDRLEAEFENAYFHDWSHDPFSRGTYSYLGVGGLAAQTELARPVEETLFFAGEATHAGGQSGTVHGAIASGQRAAREALLSLSGHRPEVSQRLTSV